jgi:hypothetical protein
MEDRFKSRVLVIGAWSLVISLLLFGNTKLLIHLSNDYDGK